MNAKFALIRIFGRLSILLQLVLGLNLALADTANQIERLPEEISSESRRRQGASDSSFEQYLDVAGEKLEYAASQAGELISNVADRATDISTNATQVKAIVVNGNHYLSSQEIINLLNLQLPIWTWEFSLADLKSRLEANPWIERVQILRSPGSGTLKVNISEAEPWLVIACREESWLISRTERPLTALSAINDQELLLKTAELTRLEANHYQGSRQDLEHPLISKALRSIAYILNVEGLGVPIETYEIQQDGSILARPHLINTPAIYFNADSHLAAVQLKSNLSKILTDLKTRNERAQSVDLRFDGQAIVKPALQLLAEEKSRTNQN
ncbi:FtsQ-type POTRA domain-containing protein [bacterium]|nr:FtsQ-type POTRA domain-containing protein [bacterium]